MKVNNNQKKTTPAQYSVPKTCEFCGSPVILTSNKYIYGREYGNGLCYMCTGLWCDAYVGVHDGSCNPKGRLADKELRTLRKRAHALFDPLWKTQGKYRMTRSGAYSWLARELDISPKECHFSWFDKAMIRRAIRILQEDAALKKNT